MYIVTFIVGAGLGLALGFYSGLTARQTAEEERQHRWKRRR